MFVPPQSTDLVSRAALDLAVNMVSFQEMTGGQVDEYARIAAAAGCRALYSMNRERSPFNTELTGVSQVLGTRFDVRAIELLDGDYTSVTKKPPQPGKAPPVRKELSYRHVVAVPRRPGGSLLARLARAFS